MKPSLELVHFVFKQCIMSMMCFICYLLIKSSNNNIQNSIWVNGDIQNSNGVFEFIIGKFSHELIKWWLINVYKIQIRLGFMSCHINCKSYIKIKSRCHKWRFEVGGWSWSNCKAIICLSFKYRNWWHAIFMYSGWWFFICLWCNNHFKYKKLRPNCLHLYY